MERIAGHARSLSLDLYDQWHMMETTGGKWRYTSPAHTMHALAAALMKLEQEDGIEARYERYACNHQVLVEGMKPLGFQPVLPTELQGPIITSFHYPNMEGREFVFSTFYEGMKQEGFVIYPGKLTEADTFRVGTIGHVFPEDMKRFIQAVSRVMARLPI